MSELDPIVFEFDRYIKGVKMAQGVTIERERDLPSAMRRAATLASRGLNGEVPVLVLRSTVSPLSDGDGRIKALEAELLAAREALSAARWYVEAYDTVGMNTEQTRVLELVDSALSGNRSGN